MAAELKLVGGTVDGVPLIGNVFAVHSTTGEPLDMLLSRIEAMGAQPHLVQFYRDALASGMSHKRVLAKIGEAVGDACGPVVRADMLRRLEAMFG